MKDKYIIGSIVEIKRDIT